MDRQNVEYIEREDDEEFDEFGRKKKRKKFDNKAEEVSIRNSSKYQNIAYDTLKL